MQNSFVGRFAPSVSTPESRATAAAVPENDWLVGDGVMIDSYPNQHSDEKSDSVIIEDIDAASVSASAVTTTNEAAEASHNPELTLVTTKIGLLSVDSSPAPSPLLPFTSPSHLIYGYTAFGSSKSDPSPTASSLSPSLLPPPLQCALVVDEEGENIAKAIHDYSLRATELALVCIFHFS